MSIDWKGRVDSIKTYNKLENGKMSYAVNKPLLILYLISQLKKNGKSDSSWKNVEESLGKILQNYGKKRNSIDPFFRLRSDGLFVVKDLDSEQFKSPQQNGYKIFLNNKNPVGNLPREFEEYLKEDKNMQTIVGLILKKYFQPTIFNEVLADVGLDIDYILPVKNNEEVKRDRLFAKNVLRKYGNKCLFCGYFGIVNGSNIGIEAAHVVMHSRGGSNESDNGIPLCSLCHKMFDRGAITLNPDYKIIISKYYEGRISIFTNKSLMKGNKNIAENFKWHRDEIFNG